jgi:thiamine biosynthesis lipoprotein ApbE
MYLAGSVILKSIFNCVAVAVALTACGAHANPPAAPLAAAREYLMGTIAEVRVHAAPDDVAPAALEAALAELRALDRLLAVQRADSQLSRLNREAARGAVDVDARLIEVLVASGAVSRATGGAFDVTVLPAVRAWGFTDGRPHRPADARPVPAAGFPTVVVDAAARTVRFTNARTQVDLGGIGKGYALDRARAVLRAHGVRSAYLDLGGNVATVGTPPGEERWRIGIRHPRRPDVLLGVVEIGEASVSTSGDAEQFVVVDGKRSGHVFDPRTGRPADALISATVVSPSATQADALSTAAVVLGADRAGEVLARLGADGVFARLDAAARIALTVTAGARFRPDDGSHPEHRRVSRPREER